MSMRHNNALDIPDANGNGVQLEVREYAAITVFVHGTFVADIQIQISPDGTNWHDEGSVINAPGVLQVTKQCIYVRASVANYVSGSPTGMVVGERN